MVFFIVSGAVTLITLLMKILEKLHFRLKSAARGRAKV